MYRNKLPILVFISALIIAAAGFAIYVVIGLGNGKLHLGNEIKSGNYIASDKSLASEKWNEGVIEYNGQKYIYNSSIRTYLIMGVDKEGPAVAGEDYVRGGQSDAMFLLVTDKSSQTISVIPINRNTMAEIHLCDTEGHYYGRFKAQICLQHGYGDGLKGSCRKSVEAVSKLFYDIPITGYVAMNMDAMRILNHLAGGVTVEVLEDLEYPELNVHLKQGETVKLNDDEAYVYLRDRDTDVFGTATKRLEREEQYALGLYENLKEVAGGNKQKALDMYDEVEPYLCTNIVFADIAEDLMQYGFDSHNVYNIPGELVQGKNYEEFYIDKSALYDIIISIMYKNHEG